MACDGLVHLPVADHTAPWLGQLHRNAPISDPPQFYLAMHPRVPGYIPPSHAGDPRPSLQVNTNALHTVYSAPPYTVGPGRIGHTLPCTSTIETNAYNPGSTPSISPTPASSVSVAHPEDPSPKRKRSRVTPEQLTRLEELFASDRSPTVSRRKEISAELGMRERQTQIWFQNRRAKAKVQEGRGKPRTKKSSAGKNRRTDVASPESMTSGQDLSPEEEDNEDEPPSGRPPPPSTHPHYDQYVADRFREPGPIRLIPCHLLKIGSWPTLSDPTRGRELVAFVAQRQAGAVLVMLWFFSNGGRSYKLELPISAIESTHVSFELAASGDRYPTAVARLTLSHAPTFYVLSESPGEGGATPTSSVRQHQSVWTACQDFTQGGSGATARVYEMQGPAQSMVQALTHFPNYSQDGGLSPTLIPPLQLSRPQPGMVVPLLPSLPLDGSPSYPVYSQSFTPQHPSIVPPTSSGASSVLYPRPYLQQSPALQRQTSFPQPANQPTFAYDMNAALPSQGFTANLSPLSDPGTSNSTADYSARGSRPFTTETLTTPFFPDLNSPTFQEAAASLMNDEPGAHLYPPFPQRQQYSPADPAPHADTQLRSSETYPDRPHYVPSIDPGSQGGTSSTPTREYQMPYSSHPVVSQFMSLQPPSLSQGYTTAPSEGSI
ncbi:hypothetical protein DACRYDRAFT_114058 [Dacryopinax primogenitus]|uniref:Homeobox domain-containing protein n=1 Tax=Dacryopinax primogenitus (strain DJM 731) TaxID=1858805 RepID=M5G951_DACPD|nr:uncharacterized protein DACRYDRAFT_114058 [Dacryopinax primogenitus]EJU04705.1 hypothetical protein DACRYDRAFT_114058 [Dacryopinax primogenitus]